MSIDTRSLKKGNIFFAIKGENFNGNNFALEAIKKGACLAIVDDNQLSKNEKCFFVEDALQFLQDLAKFHRNKLTDTVFIAIAGSNGKTTTKEILSSILATQFSIFSTKGNLNNHIGLPLSILSVIPDNDVAILELGANHLNEHTFLCSILQPDIGCITNCGKDHLEGYGTVENVIKSNKEVFDYCKENHKIIFLNSEDNALIQFDDYSNAIYFGNNPKKASSCKYRVLDSVTKLHLSLTDTINNNSVTVATNTFGSVNALNFCAAVSLSLFLNVSFQKIISAIKTFRPLHNRSSIVLWHERTVYLDAYNANPSSMGEFIDFISNHNNKHKTVILGAMEELGEMSFHEHSLIIDRLKNIDIYKLILVGEAFQSFSDIIECDFYKFTKYIDKSILSDPNSGPIFVKGSRKFRLEELFL